MRHDLLGHPITIAIASDRKLAVLVSPTAAGELTIWGAQTWTEQKATKLMQHSSETFSNATQYNVSRSLLSISDSSSLAIASITTRTFCEI